MSISIDEWMKKLWYIYYLAIKKEAATWMVLEIVILSEVRQRKYHIAYMCNLKMIQINLFTKQIVSQT